MKNLNIKGTTIPALGFGTYELRGKECVEAVRIAIDSGYMHIDTAQIYENEAEVGEGIKKSGKRDKIFLTTKIWRNEFAAGTAQKSVDESLKKLKTDYVDLLLVHWPFPEVPVAQMVAEVMTAKEAEKAKAIGVSNFTVSQMEEALKISGGEIVCNQVEYHPYLSQKPVLEFVQKSDMALTAYSPVARGKIIKDKAIQEIGLKYGKNAGQVGLRWLIQQNNVAAIPKSGTSANIKSNIDIFDFELTAEEMKKIHTLAKVDGRQVNPSWGPKWDVAA